MGKTSTIRSLFDEFGDLPLDDLDDTRIYLKVAVLRGFRRRGEENRLPF